MNAFRKNFKTSRGLAGIDLINWNSKDGQEGLAEMTSAYLDGEGKGNSFWPDDKSAANYSPVVCDESGHTKFPFSFVVLSWGELCLICPELPLILPRARVSDPP